MRSPPLIHAMVLCDAVHVDPTTGKATILGTFSHLDAASFPFVQASMAVFIQMTDVRGQVPLHFRVTRVVDDPPGEREVLRTLTRVYSVPSPLTEVELDTTLVDVRFDEPGEYGVQFLVWGRVSHERRLSLRQVP